LAGTAVAVLVVPVAGGGACSGTGTGGAAAVCAVRRTVAVRADGLLVTTTVVGREGPADNVEVAPAVDVVCEARAIGGGDGCRARLMAGGVRIACLAAGAATKSGAERMREGRGAGGPGPHNGQAGAGGLSIVSRTLYIEPSMYSSKLFNSGSVRPIQSALACHTCVEAAKVTPSR
jgi:hypothetical protein